MRVDPCLTAPRPCAARGAPDAAPQRDIRNSGRSQGLPGVGAERTNGAGTNQPRPLTNNHQFFHSPAESRVDGEGERAMDDPGTSRARRAGRGSMGGLGPTAAAAFPSNQPFSAAWVSFDPCRPPLGCDFVPRPRGGAPFAQRSPQNLPFPQRDTRAFFRCLHSPPRRDGGDSGPLRGENVKTEPSARLHTPARPCRRRRARHLALRAARSN